MNFRPNKDCFKDYMRDHMRAAIEYGNEKVVDHISSRPFADITNISVRRDQGKNISPLVYAIGRAALSDNNPYEEEPLDPFVARNIVHILQSQGAAKTLDTIQIFEFVEEMKEPDEGNCSGEQEMMTKQMQKVLSAFNGDKQVFATFAMKEFALPKDIVNQITWHLDQAIIEDLRHQDAT